MFLTPFSPPMGNGYPSQFLFLFYRCKVLFLHSMRGVYLQSVKSPPKPRVRESQKNGRFFSRADVCSQVADYEDDEEVRLCKAKSREAILVCN